jgi:hypothetical protein
MLIDELDETTVWEQHLGGTAGIGGVAPKSASITLVPDDHASWLMQIAGNAAPPNGFPCNMFFTTRPIYSTTGCTREFELTLSGSAPTCAQVYECDGMFPMTCSDGKIRMFNGSVQYLNGVGWMVVNAAGSWVATGINPKMGPGKHKISITHTWSLTANTMSVTSITTDGVQGLVPAALQKVACAISTWPPEQVNIQFQTGSLPAGGTWSMRPGKVRNIWPAAAAA